MTRRGLYANTGRPPGPPPRAEIDRARILSELEAIQLELSRPAKGSADELGVATWRGRHTGLWLAYWCDAQGNDWRTAWAGSEAAAVQLARLQIRRHGVPGPGVRFVARRRGCSALELMRASGGLEYKAGEATAVSEPTWIRESEPIVGADPFSTPRREYSADERYFERQGAQDGRP